MKKIAGISLIAAGLLLALIYVGDYAALRLRIRRNTAYGTVTVRVYYAVQEKNGRTEYVFGSMQDQSCVNSLFGHEGQRPCWYLRRHPEQQVEI